jgi:protein-tyrosine phosphatase
MTPHLKASDINAGAEPAIARRDAVLEGLRPMCPAPIALLPGFEILLDQPVDPLALGDRRLALAGSRYYLVEFPVTIVGELATRVLQDIARAGVVPVLAHPERYRACSLGAVRAWRAAGALMQVDARTLTRPTSRGQLARRVVGEGLADVIAADNHGDGRSLRAAVEFLRGRAGGQGVVEDALRLLTHLNPLAITRDWAVAPVPGMVVPERWLERVRRFLAG